MVVVVRRRKHQTHFITIIYNIFLFFYYYFLLLLFVLLLLILLSSSSGSTRTLCRKVLREVESELEKRCCRAVCTGNSPQMSYWGGGGGGLICRKYCVFPFFLANAGSTSLSAALLQVIKESIHF